MTKDDPFEGTSGSVARRVMTGLVKVGIAIKSHAWQEAEGRNLTPTQGQILALLRLRSSTGLRLSELADGLAVSLATTSETVDTLVQKGFVQKTRLPQDGRVRTITLTETGKAEADRVAGWPDFLLDAVDTLSPAEQTVFLHGLIKMIRALQERGQIPVSRMCVTCRFFRPHVYPESDRPHHCAFVDLPFGDRHLRLECPDHEPSPPEAAERIWKQFVSLGSE
ncbi:MarR family transcriptional regulator [Ktedonosporobacter rubrisoli]|uniref:MarR family transcriptional regulator n=2 Tax=Ktedonosporobacter rubrisoli TaxID=2509675 RepID=A0A4P6K5P2_KTERU|nr:MarR family transcriptional regulator [Ktedonosporobacter rubrisoli]